MSSVRLLSFALAALLVASGCVTIAPRSPLPSPSASPAIVPATDGPTAGTTAPASERPSASVRPSRGPTASPEEALARFADVWQDGATPYHLVSEELVQDGVVRIEGNVAGPDFSGQTTIETIGLEMTFRVVVVDGEMWVLDPVSGWISEFADEGTTEPINPLASGISTLEYLRPLSRGDVQLHVLRTTEWTGAPFVGPLRNLRVASSVLDVFVTDDGVPVEASLDYVFVGEAFGIDDNFIGSRINYTFSEVGLPVEIRKPVEGDFGIT